MHTSSETNQRIREARWGNGVLQSNGTDELEWITMGTVRALSGSSDICRGQTSFLSEINTGSSLVSSVWPTQSSLPKHYFKEWFLKWLTNSLTISREYEEVQCIKDTTAHQHKNSCSKLCKFIFLITVFASLYRNNHPYLPLHLLIWPPVHN